MLRPPAVVLIVFALGCAEQAPPPPPPDPGVHVVKPETASYLIDPTTESCFLLHGSYSLDVSCYRLHKNNPEAAKAITWVKPPEAEATTGSGPFPTMTSKLKDPSTTRSTSRRALMEEIEKGVNKVDDNSYEIDRSVVDKILANPTIVGRGARIVPAVKNGKPNGFKLYAIRPSSVYAKIGLMNGDTIHSINGLSLTTPDRALEVYTKLRDTRKMRVELTRRGKSIALNYEIR